MKWTGLSAVACAALLTIACADARSDRDDDNRTATGSSGSYTDDDSSVLDDDDDARLEPRVGVGTSGQAQGPMHGAMADAKHFAEMASMHGNAELQLSQLATERAQNAEVKQFAQMMVRDHTKASNELKQAVSGQNVTLKADLDQKHEQMLSRLRTLRGAEFDREYMKAMVDGHMEMRSMLQARTDSRGQPTTGARTGTTDDARTHGGANPAATGTTGAASRTAATTELDTAVDRWATNTQPTVEQHLQKAQQIQGKVGSGTTRTNPR